MFITAVERGGGLLAVVREPVWGGGEDGGGCDGYCW